jgi:hypothetical protein
VIGRNARWAKQGGNHFAVRGNPSVEILGRCGGGNRTRIFNSPSLPRLAPAPARPLPKPDMGSKRKSKPGRSRKKTKAKANQALALDYVRAWAQPAPPPASDSAADDFLPAQAARGGDVLFELHSHSNHSDGFLSPSALVERAHRNGVSRALSDLFLRLPGNCSMKCLDCLIAGFVLSRVEFRSSYLMVVVDRRLQLLLMKSQALRCYVAQVVSVVSQNK